MKSILLILVLIFVDGVSGWDIGVAEASEIYSHRIHNIFCDNCHSHVAKALDIMKYKGKTNWNMIILCFMVFFKAKFVGYEILAVTYRIGIK